MNWTGHTLRGDSLLRRGLLGRTDAKKAVGRPRMTAGLADGESILGALGMK